MAAKDIPEINTFGSRLHDLPRYNFEMQPVGNQFRIASGFKLAFGIFPSGQTAGSDYVESIELLFFLTFGAGCVYILIQVVLSTLFCCCCAGEDESKYEEGVVTTRKLTPSARLFTIFLCFLSCVVMMVGLGYSWETRTTIQSIDQGIDDSYEPYSDIMDDGKHLQVDLDNLQGTLNDIDQEAQSKQWPIQPQVQLMAQTTGAAEDTIGEYVTTGEKVDWREYSGEMDTAQDYIFYGCATLLLHDVRQLHCILAIATE